MKLIEDKLQVNIKAPVIKRVAAKVIHEEEEKKIEDNDHQLHIKPSR